MALKGLISGLEAQLHLVNEYHEPPSRPLQIWGFPKLVVPFWGYDKGIPLLGGPPYGDVSKLWSFWGPYFKAAPLI